MKNSDDTSQLEFEITEDVEFEFINFNWNKHEVEDGTILKACHVPVKIFRTSRTDQHGYPVYLVLGKDFVTAHVPKELRQPPSSEPFDPENDQMEIIQFTVLREPWNSFELSDGTTLKIRLITNQVHVSEKRNAFGEPIYQITKTLSISAVFPPHLRKK